MEFDMLALGPARMDVFVNLPEEEINEACSIDRQRCVIEWGFGDKGPVKAMQFEGGGNTGNNAGGLARLGYKTGVVGTRGGEWVDLRALEILKKEGVNVDNVHTIPGKYGFGVVIGYQGERTILSYYPESECLFKFKSGDDTAKWTYLTTAGQDFECFYEDAVKWVGEKGVRMAFNPGSRQVKMGVEKIKYAYEAAEIIFVNKEEAVVLLNIQDSKKIQELLTGLKSLGPKVAVITDGPEGAYAYDGQKYWFMPTVTAPVVERTGAGDAFGSGFLGAFMKGLPIPEALKWGACNSASVLGYVGPQAGLLNQQQMQEWLEKNREITAKEI